MSRLKFQLEREGSGTRARAASFQTLHGEVKTPIFMPVGTQATVKSQSVDSLRRAGSRILLANTYHLLLRPGREVFEKFGGIHRFMNWDGPVLTDSGGFQIFSLPHSRQMNEEGAQFQSYVDGRKFLLSPEESIRMQRAIGSDIMMALDQCIPSTATFGQAEEAMHLTHRWARRSLAARGESSQALFGIVQGACFHDLRKQSADFLTQLEFDGFAIGGLAVGESKQQRDEFTEATALHLPKDLPRYLMGVGTPLDILEAVHRGVDMFDCILPSALSQRGVAFTSSGKLQLRRGAYKFSEDSIDPRCSCDTCRSYSKAYIHHLIKADEVLGWQLLTFHNLVYYHQLMVEMRESLFRNAFADYYEIKKAELLRTDEDQPIKAPIKKKRKKPVPAQLGDYDVHIASQGFASIRQISSGEVMHSVSEPSQEATLLYIEQSDLAKRLTHPNERTRALVIWDVGLGAASNAMAAIRCFESKLKEEKSKEGQSRENVQLNFRSLSVISFEKDLDSLRLASKHPVLFPHLRHGAPFSLLEKGRWDHPTGLLSWILFEGDFQECFKRAPVPDLIFYDPFSFKTDSNLWTPSMFSEIYEKCKDHPTELFTYSASTAVRAALLSAGFFVARGVGTGPKQETTVAFTLLDPDSSTQKESLLGPQWLQRWDRSAAKFPFGIPVESQKEFTARIERHPQFTQAQ